ncbi:MAG: PIG-L family deacetylase [Calditrichaceae bacterium]|nr:PIG-L family deacetylase [Calditrichia bacterium]NUQ40314.1 PIG-L family deacetylase [Calditrichaceae bacterium]
MMNILAIFAHPDDEAYGPGATLARYALTGHRVSLVTLTRGEAGSLGICKELPAPEVAEMRSRELHCAVKALHLHSLKIYDLPDKGLQHYPEEKGMEIVRGEIAAHRPDILLTFHPGGISGHSDHIAVTRWCEKTVLSLDAPPRLFYYGVSPEMAERIKPYRKIIPFENGEITHVIDAREYFPYKLAAIQCHVSQLEFWESFQKNGAGEHFFGGEECFSRALPRHHTNGVLKDLAL